MLTHNISTVNIWKKNQISKQYAKYSVLLEGFPYSHYQFFQGVSAIPLFWFVYGFKPNYVFDDELTVTKQRLFLEMPVNLHSFICHFFSYAYITQYITHWSFRGTLRLFNTLLQTARVGCPGPWSVWFWLSKDTHSTTSLGILAQCLTSPTVRKFFLVCRWSFLYVNLDLLPLGPPLGITEESLSPSSSSASYQMFIHRMWSPWASSFRAE